MKEEMWKMADGTNINMCVWDNVEYPKGILQILHGMSEHMRRYDGFAEYMNALGFIVVGNDMRAHGKTHPQNLGIIVGGGDLFTDNVSDAREISDKLVQKYKLPLVLFGHSYGSFLLQSYILQGTENIAGVVLMGSALMKGLIVNIGYKMAASKCKKGKGTEKGQTFANMTFVNYDKKIKDGINGWLSRDLVQVGKYNTDPMCGFVCSNGFYKSFFGGLKTIADSQEKIRPDLKMLIVSGEQDCVGGCGKLVKKLGEHYRDIGLNPNFKLFSGDRHELLNETNNKEVYEYVSNFVCNCIV